MPHFPRTPEALLGRNDSKNAATTCRGITSSGRPCRRALASPKNPPSKGEWAISNADGVDTCLESNYCWQHKTQAERLKGGEQQQQSEDMKQIKHAGGGALPVLQERNSIDTLMQKLDIQNDAGRKRRSKRRRSEGRQDIPHKIGGFSRSHSRMEAGSGPGSNTTRQRQSEQTKHQQRHRPRGFWASLCCFTEEGNGDDYLEVVRHRRRTCQLQPEMVEASVTPHLSASTLHPVAMTRPSHTPLPTRKSVSSDIYTRPSTRRSTSNPQTTHLLSLIPQYLSPTTTSTLLAELVKPISPHDEEGYIYIFWLTPQNRKSPSEEAARSLLCPPQRSGQERSVSDVMREFSYDGMDFDIFHAQTSKAINPHGSGARRTIKLKIGRANNVTRRMHEWQRQCGHALTLVRWYPYLSSANASTSASPSPVRRPSRQSTQPSLYPDLTRPLSDLAMGTERKAASATSLVKKVSCVKRVERLIHIELADKQVKRTCDACGKEHREWFEVEASHVGVKGVDECIRRWVAWAERNSTGNTMA